jgi:hypothetical protein
MRRGWLVLKLLSILGILGLVAGCLCLVPEFVIHFPMDYVVEAEFQELPPDDEELDEWLLAQPDVYIGYVQRDGNRIIAVWGNSRTHWWNAVTPNLRSDFERFGYKNLVSYRESKKWRDK